MNPPNNEKGFWKWWRETDFQWAHWPHPSKADYFGIASICLLYPVMFGSIILAFTRGPIWTLLTIPLIGATGWTLMKYALYLDQKPSVMVEHQQ